MRHRRRVLHLVGGKSGAHLLEIKRVVTLLKQRDDQLTRSGVIVGIGNGRMGGLFDRCDRALDLSVDLEARRRELRRQITVELLEAGIVDPETGDSELTQLRQHVCVADVAGFQKLCLGRFGVIHAHREFHSRLGLFYWQYQHINLPFIS